MPINCIRLQQTDDKAVLIKKTASAHTVSKEWGGYLMKVYALGGRKRHRSSNPWKVLADITFR